MDTFEVVRDGRVIEPSTNEGFWDALRAIAEAAYGTYHVDIAVSKNASNGIDWKAKFS